MKDAAKYYRDQQTGLGKRFLNSIEDCVNSIHHNPELYQVRFKDIRFAYPKTFPYIVLYRINRRKKKIFIIAILHTSLSPDKWTKRI
jgi:plasmid stabilization system protein ParE